MEHLAVDPYIKITQWQANEPIEEIHAPYYYVVLINGSVNFSVDFNTFTCLGKNLLFLSPYQLLQWETAQVQKLLFLQFHGDFYCIEYHKKEVACNGILFNNIYDTPIVRLTEDLYEEVLQLFNRIKNLEASHKAYDLSISRSYLQLLLALSSREKQLTEAPGLINQQPDQDILRFKDLLETKFIQERSVAYYAGQYALSVNAFSKKVKKQFGKNPSKLIQERLTLEAKRLLHLSFKSVKEIAAELGFEDEFYFSRYFKKDVGVSPKQFRDRVGISIVAKKSK